MNFNVTKKLVFAAILVLLSQNSSFAVDDVWGGMGISDDSIQYNNDYANTVFEKYTTPSNNQTPDISTKQYPTNLSTQTTTSSVSKENKTIKNIEFYGLNSVPQSEITDKMQMKAGEEYTREKMQADLKTIYETGYFTEKMKAIPTTNPDGTVSVKIVVEENIPVKDFTIEGNSVIPTEDILATLTGMKGKPQNITQLNIASGRTF